MTLCPAALGAGVRPPGCEPDARGCRRGGVFEGGRAAVAGCQDADHLLRRGNWSLKDDVFVLRRNSSAFRAGWLGACLAVLLAGWLAGSLIG